MIRRSNHYSSINRTLWHHINFNAVYESRKQQANENDRQAVNVTEQYKVTAQEQEPVLLDA